jgi:hypothetical protein
MSILKETAVAVPALAVLLFVSHIFLGPDERYSQWTSGPQSWLGCGAVPAERFIAKDSITGSASVANVDSSLLEQASGDDLTPKARIRSVFAQFAPGGRRPAT